MFLTLKLHFYACSHSDFHAFLLNLTKCRAAVVHKSVNKAVLKYQKATVSYQSDHSAVIGLSLKLLELL